MRIRRSKCYLCPIDRFFDVGPECGHPVEVVGAEVERQDEGVEQLLQKQEDARLDGFDAPRETDLQVINKDEQPIDSVTSPG